MLAQSNKARLYPRGIPTRQGAEEQSGDATDHQSEEENLPVGLHVQEIELQGVAEKLGEPD